MPTAHEEEFEVQYLAQGCFEELGIQTSDLPITRPDNLLYPLRYSRPSVHHALFPRFVLNLANSTVWAQYFCLTRHSQTCVTCHSLTITDQSFPSPEKEKHIKDADGQISVDESLARRWHQSLMRRSVRLLALVATLVSIPRDAIWQLLHCLSSVFSVV